MISQHRTSGPADEKKRLGHWVYLRNLSFRLVRTTLMQQKQMQQQGGMLNLYTFSITLLAKNVTKK
jgi:hypothetical protein